MYVGQLRRRFQEFEQARQREMRVMKHDFIARFITDHIVLGNKSAYDSMLQSMLNEQEREQLETDPRFTRAWRIFVDLCWIRQQLIRAGLILGGIVALLVLAALFFWALPHIAGPGGR